MGCSPWGRYESDTTERLHLHTLEKEMATHSSVLAVRIPGMGEPGGLLSMGSHRVRHDLSDLAAAAAAEIYMRHEKSNEISQSEHPYVTPRSKKDNTASPSAGLHMPLPPTSLIFQDTEM